MSGSFPVMALLAGLSLGLGALAARGAEASGPAPRPAISSPGVKTLAASPTTRSSRPTSGPVAATTRPRLRETRAMVVEPTTRPSVAAAGLKVKAQRPVKVVAMDTCADADCHADIKANAAIHGPVNVNSCDACHKLVDEQKHTYELARTKTEMCAFCHEVDTSAVAVVHKPLETGECLACHSPHGGKTEKFLRTDTVHGLCQQCHEDPIHDKQNLHGPVAAGACDGCHSPHAAQLPKLLVAEGSDLCFSCHNEMKSQLAGAKFTHKAMEKGCLECHEAHASNNPKQTKLASLELCTSCHEHEKIRNDALAATYKHTVVTKDQACLNCHTAHGGDLEKLVREEPIKVCMQCHNKPQDAGGGRTVPAVAEVLDSTLSKHGPIRDGNCSGCHNVHGSSEVGLLAKPYSKLFYESFALEKYDLCFTCHDKQLVTLANTEGLTGFRNGTTNLHFVHVNKSIRGRSCRACHSTHASRQPMQLRQSVTYGKWEMPLKYDKSENGGMCTTGCHKPYMYDRLKPVVYDDQKPTMPPAPAPAIRPGPAVRPPSVVKPAKSVTPAGGGPARVSASGAPAGR